MLLRFAEGVEIDAELLTLLVEVAAFEAKGAGHVGHVEIVAADFGEEGFAFEGFGAFDESTVRDAGSVEGDGRTGGAGSWEREAHVVGRDGFCVGKEDQTLDDIAQLANVARPGIAAQFGDGFRGEEFFFPAILRGDLAGEVGEEIGEVLEALAQGAGQAERRRCGDRDRCETRFS